MLLPSVDGIAQFHGTGHLSFFVYSSPGGIAQFYKTYGVRKRCQKSYHHRDQVGVVREATLGHMGTYRPLSPLAGFSSRTCRGSSR